MQWINIPSKGGRGGGGGGTEIHLALEEVIALSSTLIQVYKWIPGKLILGRGE